MISYLISAVLSYVVFKIKGFDFNVNVYMEMILFICFISLFMYTVNVFITISCNNMVDSIICMILGSILLFFMANALGAFISDVAYGVVSANGLVIPYDLTSRSLNALFTDFNNNVSYFMTTDFVIVIITGLMIFLSFKIFRNKKGEDAGKLTNSKYMYKLLLPVILISQLFISRAGCLKLEAYIIPAVIIIVIYIIGVFISKRKINLSTKNITFLVVAVIGVDLLYRVFSYNNGFILAHIYPRSFDNLMIGIYGDQINDKTIININLEDNEEIKIIHELQHYLVNNKSNQKDALAVSFEYDNNASNWTSYSYVVNKSDLTTIIEKLKNSKITFEVTEDGGVSFKKYTPIELLRFLSTE